MPIEAGKLDDATFFLKRWERRDADCHYRDPAIRAEADAADGDIRQPKDVKVAARQTR
jgi:hypothetical protein